VLIRAPFLFFISGRSYLLRMFVNYTRTTRRGRQQAEKKTADSFRRVMNPLLPSEITTKSNRFYRRGGDAFFHTTKPSLTNELSARHNLLGSQLNNNPTNHFFFKNSKNRFLGTVIVLVVFN
jgi:hypothetical protein